MVFEEIFDRKLLQRNYQRFAKDFANYNFLYCEVANRIDEKLRDYLKIKPKEISRTLKIEQNRFEIDGVKKTGDDEQLDFAPESFDLIISNLNLHFINNIPQFLLQIKSILKPGGIFIASFFGEENLKELRHVLYEVENELYGGVSPRVAPTIDIKTAAALLQKAGFNDPISELEKIEIEYSNPLNLLKDLKMMAQGNIMRQRSRKFATRTFLNKIKEKYLELYRANNHKVSATFEVVTIVGVK